MNFSSEFINNINKKYIKIKYIIKYNKNKITNFIIKCNCFYNKIDFVNNDVDKSDIKTGTSAVNNDVDKSDIKTDTPAVNNAVDKSDIKTGTSAVNNDVDKSDIKTSTPAVNNAKNIEMINVNKNLYKKYDKFEDDNKIFISHLKEKVHAELLKKNINGIKIMSDEYDENNHNSNYNMLISKDVISDNSYFKLLKHDSEKSNVFENNMIENNTIKNDTSYVNTILHSNNDESNLNNKVETDISYYNIDNNYYDINKDDYDLCN